MAYNLPTPYQSYGYPGVGQQMYQSYQTPAVQTAQTQQTAQSGYGLIWVDGEVGAKAFQMPAGWPANQPIALWDTNDTVIYLKSINPMGMPNPLQKAHYSLEERKTASVSERSGDSAPDMSMYVRRDDMEQMKQELMDAISSIGSTTTAAVRKTGKGEA